MSILWTDAKIIRMAENWPLAKDTQFLSNQADIQATLPTYDLISSTKFHNDWQEIFY